MIDVDATARALISALGADKTEENIEGTIEAINAIIGSINADWEMHIANDTNEILAEDNICCEECSTPISVKRYRKVLYVLNS